MLQHYSLLMQRILVGSGASVLVLLAIALSFHPIFGLILPIFWIVLATLALREFYHMATLKGFHPHSILGTTAAACYLIAATLSSLYPHYAWIEAAIAWLALLLGFSYYFFVQRPAPLVNLATSTLGFVYVALPFAYSLKINYLFWSNGHQDGRYWLLYLLVVVKMSDVVAYFVGRKWGKRPFFAHLSPKKTWEGAIAGWLAAVLMSLLGAMASGLLHSQTTFYLPWSTALFWGAFLGLLAIFGDLAESLLKRDCALKDSSHLPGLGGILDMTDSLLFSAVALYFGLWYGFI